MADMRTRAWPDSSSTSMESPSLTLATRASSTGNGFGGSAAAAEPVSSSASDARRGGTEPHDGPTSHRAAS